MKKIITILFLLVLSCSVYAQDKVIINYTLSATGAAATIPGTYLYHSFSVNVVGGTLSACNIDLEGSDDNSSWSNLIAAHDCSTKGKTAVTYGLYKYYRPYINTLTTATGTPSLEFVYYGYIDNPASSSATMQGVVNIAGSTYADGSTQNARIATDGSIFVATQGLANASAPTFAEGALKPFSMDLSGAIRTMITNLTTDTAVGSAPTENPIGTGGLYQASQSAVDTGDRTAIQTDAYGNLLTVARASATEGCTPYSLIGANTANLTAITDGPTQVCGGVITNINAAVMYVKFYDKATAPDPSACSANSDCPVLRFAIPGDTTGAGVAIPISSLGIKFTTGLGMSITTGVADTDETAVAANEVIVNLWYKH